MSEQESNGFLKAVRTLGQVSVPSSYIMKLEQGQEKGPKGCQNQK